MSKIDEWKVCKKDLERVIKYEKGHVENLASSPKDWQFKFHSFGNSIVFFYIKQTPPKMNGIYWEIFAQELSRHIPEALAAVTRKIQQQVEEARIAAQDEAREVLKETDLG